MTGSGIMPAMTWLEIQRTELVHADPSAALRSSAIESYLDWRNGDRPLDILDWETYYWQMKKTG